MASDKENVETNLIEETRNEKMAELAAIDAAAERERTEEKMKAMEATETARREKLAELSKLEQENTRERRLNAVLVSKQAEREQEDLVEQYGEAPRRSLLPLDVMKSDLERKSVTLTVKGLVDQEQRDRVEELAEAERANKQERLHAQKLADAAAEEERQRRLVVDQKAQAQRELESKMHLKETVLATEAERRRRMSEDHEEWGDTTHQPSSFLLADLQEKADDMERAQHRRMAKFLSEEARKEKIAELVEIEKREEQRRMELKKEVIDAMENERRTQLRELREMDADAKRERKLNAVRANKAMDTERDERVKEFGVEPHESALKARWPEIADALEFKATTILVKQLADAEQADRIAAAVQRALDDEHERDLNKQKVIALQEEERQRRLLVDQKAVAQQQLESMIHFKETVAATEMERERRMSSSEDDSLELRSSFDEVFKQLPDVADEMERKTNRRLAQVSSEEARKEKMAELAAIDAMEERDRADQKLAVLVAVEAERTSKLQEIKILEMDAKRERHLNAVRANKAMETERYERLHEHGVQPQKTALSGVLEVLKPEMERKATSILVKHLVDDEQRQRIVAAIEAELANERERLESCRLADLAMEEERERRLFEDKKAAAQRELESKLHLKETITATEAERERRLSEEVPTSLKDAGIFEELPQVADEMERKTNRRVAQVSSEEARKEKMAELAAIDAREVQARAENKVAVLAMIETERKEKLAALKLIEMDAKRERALNAKRANKAMDAEREERIKEYGVEVHSTPLTSRKSWPAIADALERSAQTQHVKHLADQEQQDRISELQADKDADDALRRENQRLADFAMEEERQRRIQIDKKADTCRTLERQSSLKETIAATEEERQRRIGEGTWEAMHQRDSRPLESGLHDDEPSPSVHDQEQRLPEGLCCGTEKKPASPRPEKPDITSKCILS